MLWWKYTRVVGLSFTLQGHVVQSWVKITRVSAKFEFRYESLRSKISIILFVDNLMFENYTGKCLQTTGRRATWMCDLLLSAEINPALQSLKVNYDGTDPWIPDV